MRNRKRLSSPGWHALRRLGSSLAASLFAAGCAVAPVQLDVQPVLEEHYALGQPAVARVGEAIVRRRAYFVRRGPGRLRPSGDFRVTGGVFDVKVDASASGRALYEVAGTTQWEGKHAVVMAVPDINVGFLVSETGRFVGKGVLLNVGTPKCCLAYEYRIEPTDTTFEVVRNGDVPVALGGRGANFDLIYGGRTADELTLLYQEYAGRNLTRPALSRELAYDARTRLIRFFRLGIQVIEATREEIRYIVARSLPETYRGPNVSDPGVAILDGSRAGTLEIDGMTTDARTKLGLEPGSHTIRYVVAFGGSVLRGPAVRTMEGRAVLVVKAGHVYQVKAERTGDWANPRLYVWIEDVTTGEVVEGVRP